MNFPGVRGVPITQEMREQARIEARKRSPYIRHHFDVAHFTSSQRDEIGFLGEFACCVYLGRDWRANIRSNYLTIDSGDITGAAVADVKTESLPEPYFSRLIRGQIGDDELYGRRLIHAGQRELLPKYSHVIFGALERERQDMWYPLGFLETRLILEQYAPTTRRPDGGAYPFAALPVRTSQLRPMDKIVPLLTPPV